MKTLCAQKGFTLIEVLLVIAVLGIIGGAGVGYYRNVAVTSRVSATTETLISHLKGVRSRAMLGEGGMHWGVHFVSSALSNYYEVFSTSLDYADASTVIESTVYLPAGITLSDPAPNTTKDIVFNKITGITPATSVTLVSEGTPTIISVTAMGTVY